MERELECPECGRSKWISEADESNICEDCGQEMNMLTNDRCNVCGRELWGRVEHEMGMCVVCSGLSHV
jgi:hypothetical protein